MVHHSCWLALVSVGPVPHDDFISEYTLAEYYGTGHNTSAVARLASAVQPEACKPSCTGDGTNYSPRIPPIIWACIPIYTGVAQYMGMHSHVYWATPQYMGMHSPILY